MAPLAGAVVLVGSLQRLRVDSAGWFALVGLPPGTHRLEARAIGYAPGAWLVALAAGDTISGIRLALQPRAYEMTAITTTADAVSADRGLREFERRRASGQGVFITQEEIQRQQPASVGDLIRGVPGVTTTCTRTAGCYLHMVRAPRGCRAEIFVDGFPATFATSPNTSARDVVAVEIYRSLSETPNEFIRAGSTCGVVAIWTRTGNVERR